METTFDGLLNKRIWLEQPAEGFRIAVDTVLLAAAVPARAGEDVLDLGCGVGGAMLALACRVPGVRVTGIETQKELVRLCEGNIERNRLRDNLQVVRGDVTQLPSNMMGAFDHVMMNPPYHDEARHDASPDESRRIANTETAGDLALWIAGAAQALRDGGMLTLIHRADRLNEILGLVKTSFGLVRVKPVVSKKNAATKRVIVQADKMGAFALKSFQPFVMHRADGGYTAEADAILRDVKAFEIG